MKYSECEIINKVVMKAKGKDITLMDLPVFLSNYIPADRLIVVDRSVLAGLIQSIFEFYLDEVNYGKTNES